MFAHDMLTMNGKTQPAVGERCLPFFVSQVREELFVNPIDLFSMFFSIASRDFCQDRKWEWCTHTTGKQPICGEIFSKLGKDYWLRWCSYLEYVWRFLRVKIQTLHEVSLITSWIVELRHSQPYFRFPILCLTLRASPKHGSLSGEERLWIGETIRSETTQTKSMLFWSVAGSKKSVNYAPFCLLSYESLLNHE